MTLLGRTTAIARNVRAELLNYAETPRDLAGQCGLAAMLVASALGNPKVLRTGFFLKREKLFGGYARLPNRHAWCRVGPMLIDVTATQFGRRYKAVHVVRIDEDTRYTETARGEDAIDDIMTHWRGHKLYAYALLAKNLRQCASSPPSTIKEQRHG